VTTQDQDGKLDIGAVELGNINKITYYD